MEKSVVNGFVMYLYLSGILVFEVYVLLLSLFKSWVSSVRIGVLDMNQLNHTDKIETHRDLDLWTKRIYGCGRDHYGH